MGMHIQSYPSTSSFSRLLTEDGLQGNKNVTGHPASCPGAPGNLCHMECCPGVMFQYLENSSGAWNRLAGVLLLDTFVLSQRERYPSSISHESLWAVFPGWGVFWGTSANEKYVFVSSIKFSAGLQLKCGCDNSYLNAASEVFVGDTQHPLRADCCCLARCYSACGGSITNILLVLAGLLFLWTQRILGFVPLMLPHSGCVIHCQMFTTGCVRPQTSKAALSAPANHSGLLPSLARNSANTQTVWWILVLLVESCCNLLPILQHIAHIRGSVSWISEESHWQNRKKMSLSKKLVLTSKCLCYLGPFWNFLLKKFYTWD